MYFRFSSNIFKNDISTFFRTNKIENNQKVNYRGYCPIIFFLRLQKILQIMKSIILKILVLLVLVACNKDDDKIKSNPVFKLPPETQIGANTFGVTINGKVYIPRDPTGGGVMGSGKGMVLWGTSDNSWYELEIKDGASSVGFNMVIHMEPLLSTGQILLKQSNFQDNVDSIRNSHIYFKIWDASISNYAYYGSVENECFLNITRLDGGILSGTFSGKFVRYDNSNEFITINDGRFDINGFTLPNHPFP